MHIMATIRKTSGLYYARFYDRSRSPQRKSYPLRTGDKRAAHRKLNELEAAYQRGDFDPWRGGWQHESVSAQEALERFLKHKQGSVREQTSKTYRQQLEACLGTLPAGLHMADVRGADLRPYIHQPDVSSATQRKRYRHVRAWLNWCRKEGLTDANVIDDVQQPSKEHKEAAYLRPVDVERLLIAIDHHVENTTCAIGRTPDLKWLKHIILVAVGTGLRSGELRALRWVDVDLSGRRLHVRHRNGFKTKGNAERIVPLRGDALDTLRRMSEQADSSDGLNGRKDYPSPSDGPVFVDERGLPIDVYRLSHRFKDMARLAGLDERINFHSLRHTCASWLVQRGVSLPIVQKILGHSTIAVTERYSHLAPDVLDKAMEQAFE